VPSERSGPGRIPRGSRRLAPEHPEPEGAGSSPRVSQTRRFPINALAWLNGEFCPIHEAKVSIEDRGFQFGDGIYEVIRVYDGRPFLLERHLERLCRSVAAIGLEVNVEELGLARVIDEGVQRSGMAEAVVYIQITRGAAPRIHDIPRGLPPTVVVTFRPAPVVPAELRERGVSVMTTREIRWANCYIKAITLLPNILVRTEARRRGYYEAVFVTDQGEVRETTAANIFAVRQGRLRMPPRTQAVLHGITQSLVLDCAARVDVPVEERAFHLDFLRAADEAFISSTTLEVLGVTRIDDQPVGDGTVGPITRRLHEELVRHARRGPCRSACAV